MKAPNPSNRLANPANRGYHTPNPNLPLERKL